MDDRGTARRDLLVTRLTRATRGPAGAAYIRASRAPRILRATGLLRRADELEIKVLTALLGMSYAGVAHYCPGTAVISRICWEQESET